MTNRQSQQDSFQQSFQNYHERSRGEHRPLQSDFVSSKVWTSGDLKDYRAQALSSLPGSTGPTQDSKVSSTSDTSIVMNRLIE